jgi:hypothetical protein
MQNKYARAFITIVTLLTANFAFIATTPQPAAARIQRWDAHACKNGVYVSVEMDNAKDAAPAIGFHAPEQYGQMHIISTEIQENEPYDHIIYNYFAYLNPSVPIGGEITISHDGVGDGKVTVGGDCSGLGRITGTAFLDKNANGVWDKGESIFPEAWMKVTGGGVWFVCGWVGGDATFGVPVKPGQYIVMPVAPKGYRTTTPKLNVDVIDLGFVAFDTNMGFVADPTAQGDACDQYNPPRP